jgi:transposase, IS5 family
MTDAAVHDSQKLDAVLDLSNTGKEVRADTEGLAEPYPPARRPQSSAVRASQVGEHDTLEGARPVSSTYFDHQQSAMGGKIVRTIGIARARFKIGMMNLGKKRFAAWFSSGG